MTPVSYAVTSWAPGLTGGVDLRIAAGPVYIVPTTRLHVLLEKDSGPDGPPLHGAGRLLWRTGVALEVPIP